MSRALHSVGFLAGVSRSRSVIYCCDRGSEWDFSSGMAMRSHSSCYVRYAGVPAWDGVWMGEDGSGGVLVKGVEKRM